MYHRHVASFLKAVGGGENPKGGGGGTQYSFAFNSTLSLPFLYAPPKSENEIVGNSTIIPFFFVYVNFRKTFAARKSRGWVLKF